MDLKNKITVIQNLLSANKFTQAIHNCKKLINQYPNLAYIYNLCGLAYQGNREMFKSIDLFSKALSIEPGNLSAKNNIAKKVNISETNTVKELIKFIEKLLVWEIIVLIIDDDFFSITFKKFSFSSFWNIVFDK